MNERFKELAREAGLLVYTSGTTPTKLEKFAELIARDCSIVCIGICRKVHRNPFIPEDDQARKIIKEIKQHFGVEE